MNIPHKIFVSYEGGCAGDMLCASLNHIDISIRSTGIVENEVFSIKKFEPFAGSHDIQYRAQCLDHVYISTHEFQILIDGDLPMINVFVKDPGIAAIIIYRQMTLQNLRIQVDSNSHWFQITKSLCLADRHQSAARYWLKRAQTIWHERQQKRLQKTSTELCVDSLFEADFPEMAARSIPALDTDIFRNNHWRWLTTNHRSLWTEENTVQSMTEKLRCMDWTQERGLIKYR
jgi:hypothetical protein